MRIGPKIPGLIRRGQMAHGTVGMKKKKIRLGDYQAPPGLSPNIGSTPILKAIGSSLLIACVPRRLHSHIGLCGESRPWRCL